MKRYLRNGDELYTANILGEDQKHIREKDTSYMFLERS